MNEPYNFTFRSSSSSVTLSSTSGRSTSFYLPANQGFTLYVTSSQPECGLAGQYVFSTSTGYRYSLAPNPASSELTVTATDPASAETDPTPADVSFDADLYDIHGKKMKTKRGDHGKVVLDVRDLPEGLYNLARRPRQGSHLRARADFALGSQSAS
ncbi:MAG: T9SS type A sorting domain-containing protein [Hymenobacter sp.]